MTPKPANVMVVAIAAMAENRVIGAGNQLPWHLPEDLKFFRQSTRGKTLLMGRKTYESIGRPLPNRRTIVLSRSAAAIPEVEVVTNLGEVASRVAGQQGAELWVCGGAEIYAQTLPWWDELYLTRVKREVEGDAFFPRFEHLLILSETVQEARDFVIERYVVGK